MRFGVLAALLANANRDSKKQPQPFQPWDFFPSLEPEPMTTDELMDEACRIFGT